MIQIKSFLPIFGGFYNSIFDNVDTDCEEGNEDNSKEWDYKEYYNRIAREMTEFIKGELKPYGIDVKFDALISPREYNFGNDSINVTYTTDLVGIGKIHDYILDNESAFSKYLIDNYTGYDGFIPSHSTNVNEWLSILNQDNSELLEHKFGAILHFILTYESEFTMDDLYEYCNENGQIYVNELS